MNLFRITNHIVSRIAQSDGDDDSSYDYEANVDACNEILLNTIKGFIERAMKDGLIVNTPIGSARLMYSNEDAYLVLAETDEYVARVELAPTRNVPSV